ncbi:MAG: trimethylamine methyltransferase family protein, partial [Oricola sp.]|nr:trimethylamine methyltransferase family protein [Oricola sp.]
MDSEDPPKPEMPKPETPTDPLIAEALAEAVPADAPARLRKRGGRAANQRRGGAAIRQMPWTDVVNIDRPTEPLSPEGVDAIHNGAMRVLEEIGIEFLHSDAVAILRDAGCIVDGENVRMGRDLVMEMVGKA